MTRFRFSDQFFQSLLYLLKPFRRNVSAPAPVRILARGSKGVRPGTKGWILLPLLLLTFSPLLEAQVVPRSLPVRVEDAIRFSLTSPMGSARFAGTGGSMTSIGVDGTTLHTNPAGIGWNRYSAAQISPGFTLNNLGATLRNGGGNSQSTETKSAFIIPSASLVWAGETRSVNWSTFNFGISYTRMADFNETIAFSGRSGGSIVQAINADIDAGVVNPFREELALNIPGTFIDLGDDVFVTEFDLDENAASQIRRSGRLERTGGLNELALGFGGNYMEKVLWGFTIGIPTINFAETRVYDEVDDRNEVTFEGSPGFDNAGFDETLELTGSGVNFKFGLIGRPTEQLRLSLAVHSPTFWSVDETYFTDFEYNYTDNGEALGGEEQSPLSETAFNLQTPWRFYAGAGYLIGRSGFISVDADYQNFAGTSFSSDDFATVDEAANQDVDNTLGGSLNLRVGGELNLKPFQLRAGVGYQPLPMIDLRNGEDPAFTEFSAGVGYAKDKFFVDFAARYNAYNGYYSPYRTFDIDGQVVDTERSRITGILTVGLRGF